MRRRRLIAGLGGICSVGAGITGSGAVLSVTADRAVNVTIAPDFDTANSNGAYLEMSDTSEIAVPNISKGTLTLDFTQLNEDIIGDGFNPNSVYEIVGGDDGLFQLRNQSDNAISVAAVTADSPDALPEMNDPNTLPFDPNKIADDGPRIELFAVDDPERAAITNDNRYELSVGDQLSIGTRVIVPEISPGTYNQILVLHGRNPNFQS